MKQRKGRTVLLKFEYETTRVILVAENEPPMLNTLRSVLERNGYRTIPARNGEEIVNLARKERPDLILMDMRMPLLDGYASARVLSRDSVTRDIPIIAFQAPSGGTSGDSSGRGRNLKPFDEKQLLKQIHQALQARHAIESVRF